MLRHTTWVRLDLGKDHCLCQNKHIVQIREAARLSLNVLFVKIGGRLRHGYSNNHMVMVRIRLQSISRAKVRYYFL